MGQALWRYGVIMDLWTELRIKRKGTILDPDMTCHFRGLVEAR